jgi:hypothetical protein
MKCECGSDQFVMTEEVILVTPVIRVEGDTALVRPNNYKVEGLEDGEMSFKCSECGKGVQLEAEWVE